jgi:hypothetical protein
MPSPSPYFTQQQCRANKSRGGGGGFGAAKPAPKKPRKFKSKMVAHHHKILLEGHNNKSKNQ